ncbi:hypothetical protein HOP62_00130 [Halomonas sp. MCCC 1A17488]|uniref:Uncharacterized protein n=1 Tax=Billgrantia sulfidoxydans TaxID=2733484 RepID=A0ABX7W5X7_9GAMM|nr:MULTISPECIES: hypothetical protein [Halomonas]MCE8014484.1 hypothetical protein [Halomonas sp. MCCC 1A17488]MCG3237817.1 hypothetical protein [Halomonas sp. MCCC 1A17488]QPP48387.1 hypothetical protein I4484_14270 [Halomonas sp. SS10-MC5]QTP55699.1 hypothetical protein HNO51_14010 [Halomonas sulfidoxydans]
MFDWVSQHGDNVSVLTDVGTLIVWVVYAQLLYFSFRRQRRPRLLINRGRKKDIDALCIISNMSAEPVFIQHVVAELATSHGVVRVDVTDRTESYGDGDDSRQESDPKLAADSSPIVRDGSHQGPLGSGHFVHIDSFGALTRRLAHDGGFEMAGYRPLNDVVFRSLTIRIICIYGSEDLPVGAERCFEFIDQQPDCGLVPATWDTKRLSSHWQRRRLCREIRQLNSKDEFSSVSPGA